MLRDGDTRGPRGGAAALLGAGVVLVCGAVSGGERGADPLAEVETIHSVSLLQNEIDWAERESVLVTEFAKHENQARRELPRLLDFVEKLETVVPSSPQVEDYLDGLEVVARAGDLAIRPPESRIMRHDRYQEIVLDLEVVGPRESTETFRARAMNRARLAAWSDPVTTDGEMKVRVTIFAVPPFTELEARRCRPVDVDALPLEKESVEKSVERLESLCKRLDKRQELRDLFVQYNAARDRVELITNLAKTFRPAT